MMSAFEWSGFIIGIFVFAALSFFLARSRVANTSISTFNLAVLIRIIGVLMYGFVVFSLYGGAADPVIYARWGANFANYFASFDLSPLFDSSLYRGGDRFVGTNFVGYPAAFLVLITGQSFRGTWLVFSFLCFFGLILFARTFARAYGSFDYSGILKILLFFPPLWFWTASISKDGWVIFGVAIVLSGLVTKKRGQNFVIMALGVLWIFLVRPQIAAMVAMSIAGAYGFMSLKKFSFKNVFILILGGIGASLALSVIGVDSGISDATQFATAQRNYSSFGGSQIQLASGPIAFIQAPINILFRPFPWEVGGVLQIITFFEIYFIWFLVIKNWKSFRRAIMAIRKDRLVAFSVVFIALFSIGAGLALSNLGLIARQRIVLYPFFLILIYAYSDKRIFFLKKRRQARMAALKNG